MPISDDGFCHTKVDTIIYQTSVDENNAIVIFKSNKYDSGIPYTCHACPLMLSIATFTKRDNKWELNQFKKKFKSAGFYGENLGYFEIKRLGKNLNCLHHYEEIDGNNGFDSGMGYFYSIENNDDFEKVFQYLYYDSNSAGVEKNGYDEETKIKILKTNNYYKIESITKRLNSPTIKKRNFVYSVEHKYFIPNEVKK
jgi:hypothetical protein